MKTSFYSDLIQMCSEASVALSDFEAGQQNSDVFNKLRAIGVACVEGNALLPAIRDALGPRRKLDFQRAAFSLVNISVLTGGVNGNANVHNSLHNIRVLAIQLRDELSSEVKDSKAELQRDDQRSPSYVHDARILELKSLPAGKLDPARLIRLIEELNLAYAASSYMATAMLVRAITDHVPPVFKVDNFAQVASNYSGGKSFKGSMLHLQNSLRNIADSHLHTQMRVSESLPTERQVDFRNDLDVLLGEIVRILRMPV